MNARSGPRRGLAETFHVPFFFLMRSELPEDTVGRPSQQRLFHPPIGGEIPGDAGDNVYWFDKGSNADPPIVPQPRGSKTHRTRSAQQRRSL